jgi:hypothetical protein
MTSSELKMSVMPQKQKVLFDYLAKQGWLKDFYLAGGTALALQIGHRESIDFDFFTERELKSQEILSYLQEIGDVIVILNTDHVLHCLVNDIQIAFFSVKFNLIDNTVNHESIRICSTLDIFLMKLQAIAGGGSRKDFIDLYFLLKQYELNGIETYYFKKYNITLQSDYHLLKSLLYFDDAEKSPMPKMFVSINWEEMKEEILIKIKTYMSERKISL